MSEESAGPLISEPANRTTTAPPFSGVARRFGMWAFRSLGVIGAYIVLGLIMLYIATRSNVLAPLFGYGVLAIVVFFLIRYLSTRYVIDDEFLRARRILGGRAVPLESVRKIEYVNLNDLSPSAYFGGWGYRGRMWSPVIGPFDSIHTGSRGLLVTGSGVPLFITPQDVDSFGRELSRRARSEGVALEVDETHPPAPPAPAS